MVFTGIKLKCIPVKLNCQALCSGLFNQTGKKYIHAGMPAGQINHAYLIVAEVINMRNGVVSRFNICGGIIFSFPGRENIFI